MATEVTCDCGAVYERTGYTTPFRDRDSFECECCGRTLERWNGTTIAEFRLTSRPER
jgi:hypothetical protein